MQSHDLPQGRIEPISRNCAAAILSVLSESMLKELPADRTLADFLRRNHQLGARDRRIISETLFSVLRWWGWLKNIAPPEFVDALEHDSDATPRQSEIQQSELQQWYACFAASWYLENRPELPPSVACWLRNAGVNADDIPRIEVNTPTRARRRVLRPFFRSGDALPAMPMEELLPEWCASMVDLHADEWLRLIDAMQQRPPFWLRAQSNDIDRLVASLARENIRVEKHPFMKHALKAAFAGTNIRQLPDYRQGRIEIQDIASQAVSCVCNPKPGQHWWDACAGAGGKTLHLAALMNRKGKIIATDNRCFKLDELKTRAKRSALSNVICKEWLGIHVQRYDALFDGVLVDAPCSCSGTWRRNPGERWHCKPQWLDKLTTTQANLLNNAAQAVTHGGTLVYATCSIFKRENQDIVQAFLADNHDFALDPFISPLTKTPCDGLLQIWPWDADCDAMFIAKLKRI